MSNSRALDPRVDNFLVRLGLTQYAEAFASNDVTWDILKELGDADLQALGMSSLGHRKTILGALAPEKPAPRMQTQGARRERPLSPLDEHYVVQLVLGGEEGPLSFEDLRARIRAGRLQGAQLVRVADEQQWFQVRDIPGLYSPKEFMVALLLSIFVGSLGIDRFYLGHTGLGVAKLLTCGGIGVWHLVDIVLIAIGNLTDADGLPLRK